MRNALLSIGAFFLNIAAGLFVLVMTMATLYPNGRPAPATPAPPATSVLAYAEPRDELDFWNELFQLAGQPDAPEYWSDSPALYYLPGGLEPLRQAIHAAPCYDRLRGGTFICWSLLDTSRLALTQYRVLRAEGWTLRFASVSYPAPDNYLYRTPRQQEGLSLSHTPTGRSSFVPYAASHYYLYHKSYVGEPLALSHIPPGRGDRWFRLQIRKPSGRAGLYLSYLILP